jgi:hypothetical protein
LHLISISYLLEVCFHFYPVFRGEAVLIFIRYMICSYVAIMNQNSSTSFT